VSPNGKENQKKTKTPKNKKKEMGWVYAFANASMPGIVKIGATDREVAERLKEANKSDTWRPPRAYVIACTAEVADPFATERAIHALLASRRVDRKREFFEITADEARGLFALLAPAAALVAAANGPSPAPDPRGHVGDGVAAGEQPTETDVDASHDQPTKPAEVHALLEKTRGAGCFYYPTPYPNNENECQDWETLLEGYEDGEDSGWGARVRNLVEARRSIDSRNVGAEMEAVCGWFASKYEPTIEYEPAIDDHKSINLLFWEVYDEYLANEKPVGKSVTKAFFAKSLFYVLGVLPVHIKGDFYYWVKR
jgi:hypothetical protein